ncbi:RNA polymerase sigma factor [Alicyclobacillus sp. ALC3]|uniref:RNA polymerase sigma factor n=1 Tax=Alicyclobacillus sp. ALC3 TaxID=2796143 RepID=UPI0027A2212A|nr:RNA polymerase sigma factor [Alicyclobacillus sp. ALC3]
MERLASDDYHRFVKFAYVTVRNVHSAEDCVQEAFFTAIRKAHQYRGESTIDTWFTTILLNTCRTFRRSKIPKTGLKFFRPQFWPTLENISA